MNDMTKLSFEEAYQELALLVQKLEQSGNGTLTLDKSLALYERGRALWAYCQRLLDEAELRISRLNEGDDDPTA